MCAGAGSRAAVLNLTGPPLTATYEQACATSTDGRRTLQVIRVRQYANLNLGGAVTAADWDGDNGCVVVLDAAFTLNLGVGINVDGLGSAAATGAKLVSALQGAGATVPTLPVSSSVNFLLSRTVQ